jgi:hypothetical protein
LSYYDGLRSAQLPANLIQAQRDYFGAHTYERIDLPGKGPFHTNWTGTKISYQSLIFYNQMSMIEQCTFLTLRQKYIRERRE